MAAYPIRIRGCATNPQFCLEDLLRALDPDMPLVYQTSWLDRGDTIALIRNRVPNEMVDEVIEALHQMCMRHFAKRKKKDTG